ncbi:hypothetical protein D3OALGA1CA_5088 [Olavius algarvensis associated proteobacterium Delta 3]|nr:hypothetical protein D3OALGA1CA_5088 [Olavius algarvensis associated proteobacterium Delta 3]
MQRKKFDSVETSKDRFCAPVRIFDFDNACAPVRNAIASYGSRKCLNKKKYDIIWLEITNKCNLNCIHCYSNSSDSAHAPKMTRNDWINLLIECSESGIRHVQFTGGEPILNPDLFDLILTAKKLNIETTEIYTNGTLLNDNILKFLKMHNVSLAFSIYGNNSQTHNAFTRVPGSFEQTIRGIIKAQRYGINIRASIISICESIQNQDEIVRFLKQMNIRSFCIDRVKGVGRGNALFPEKAFVCSKACINLNKKCISCNGDIFSCIFHRERKSGNFLSNN